MHRMRTWSRWNDVDSPSSTVAPLPSAPNAVEVPHGDMLADAVSNDFSAGGLSAGGRSVQT